MRFASVAPLVCSGTMVKLEMGVLETNPMKTVAGAAAVRTAYFCPATVTSTESWLVPAELPETTENRSKPKAVTLAGRVTTMPVPSWLETNWSLPRRYVEQQKVWLVMETIPPLLVLAKFTPERVTPGGV